MSENPYQSPKELDPHPRASKQDLLLLIYLVGGGVIVGWVVAIAIAAITSEFLMKLSLGPQLGHLTTQLLFLVAMVGGGVAGAWLAIRRQR